MAVPSERGEKVTVHASSNGAVAVRRDRAPDHVVSVLFGTDLEEWRRGWNGAIDRTPDREVVVVASDISRGPTTSSPARVTPNRGLSYALVGPDVNADQLVETVSEAFAGFDSENPCVLVDDLEPLATRRGVDRAAELVERLACATTDAGGSIAIGYSLTPGTVSILASLVGVSDRIVGDDPELAAAVDRLRRADPTTFGYARRNWVEAQRGIESCTRNYPQAKQIHASLSTPETSPRTLGATLSGLVTLDVLDTWGDTVGPTRYDLTEYDRSRMASVGVVFASVAKADGTACSD